MGAYLLTQSSPTVHANLTQTSLDPPKVHSNLTHTSLDPPKVHSNLTQTSLNPPNVHSNLTQTSLDPPINHKLDDTSKSSSGENPTICQSNSKLFVLFFFFLT